MKTGLNMQKAVQAWGEPLPEWVETLARECDAAGLRATARKMCERIGSDATRRISPASLSLAIRRERGSRRAMDHAYTKERVEATLMRTILDCPVLGVIGKEECQTAQNREFTGNNPIAVLLYQSCPTCKYRKGK